MEQKISKLAKVVATAARMEKKAENKYTTEINNLNAEIGCNFGVEKLIDNKYQLSLRRALGQNYDKVVTEDQLDEIFNKDKKEQYQYLLKLVKQACLNNKVNKKAAAMTKEQILEDIFQNNIEFDDENDEARLVDDKGRLVEIFELSEKEEDLRKQFDKYVEENDLLDDKYYYFEKNEQAKEEDAYLDSYDYLYSLLVNGNISFYRERLENMTGKEIVQYINWAEEMGIDKAKLRLDLLK